MYESKISSFIYSNMILTKSTLEYPRKTAKVLKVNFTANIKLFY